MSAGAIRHFHKPRNKSNNTHSNSSGALCLSLPLAKFQYKFHIECPLREKKCCAPSRGKFEVCFQTSLVFAFKKKPLTIHKLLTNLSAIKQHRSLFQTQAQSPGSSIKFRAVCILLQHSPRTGTEVWKTPCIFLLHLVQNSFLFLSFPVCKYSKFIIMVLLTSKRSQTIYGFQEPSGGLVPSIALVKL